MRCQCLRDCYIYFKLISLIDKLIYIFVYKVIELSQYLNILSRTFDKVIEAIDISTLQSILILIIV
jgi:hypothetical protein